MYRGCICICTVHTKSIYTYVVEFKCTMYIVQRDKKLVIVHPTHTIHTHKTCKDKRLMMRIAGQNLPGIVHFDLVSNTALACQLHRSLKHSQNVSISLAYLSFHRPILHSLYPVSLVATI